MDIKDKITKIVEFVDNCPNHSIIALEGRCASGKSTIADNLSQYTIIHMDDFFLPRIRKTPARMAEVGGNIDYELVLSTIEKLKDSINNHLDKLEFEIFDCATQSYLTKQIIIKDKIILEGVYSSHYHFNDLIDYVIYLKVDKEVQYERISKRRMAQMFFNEWMKYEELYFEKYNITEKADLIV